jgi:site-specific DNA recombinase
MKLAAIYARVSSEQQREEHTIASQTAALIEFAKTHGLEVAQQWVFEDQGYSGATLERPGLERVRDLAAEGQIQVVLAYAPDHLSRKYAYQILLIEELARHGVETCFVKAPHGVTAGRQGDPYRRRYYRYPPLYSDCVDAPVQRWPAHSK